MSSSKSFRLKWPALILPLAIVFMVVSNMNGYQRLGEGKDARADEIAILPANANQKSPNDAQLKKNPITDPAREMLAKVTKSEGQTPPNARKKTQINNANAVATESLPPHRSNTPFKATGTNASSESAAIEFPNVACLSNECIQERATIIARTFPDRHDQDWIITSPSSAPPDPNYTHYGILLVKNFKAASSTAAGVALRVAAKYGKDGNMAWNRWHHARAIGYAKRHAQKSFLLSSVRDPGARALSRIFYTQISQKGEASSDTNILRHLQWNNPQYGAVNDVGGYQLRYLTLRSLPTCWNETNETILFHADQVEQHVQHILQNYDFILVAERMDESVVALSMIMAVEVGDVLVNDAKVGGSDYFLSRNKKKGDKCVRLQRTFRTEKVNTYLESQTGRWRARNYGDYLLYAAAVKSLDLTISRLGRVAFETRLGEYRRLKKQAKAMCANATVSHCSAEGKLQRHLSRENCYADDSGCGYACIDKMLASNQTGKPE
jgi:hypothetical protein